MDHLTKTIISLAISFFITCMISSVLIYAVPASKMIYFGVLVLIIAVSVFIKTRHLLEIDRD